MTEREREEHGFASPSLSLSLYLFSFGGWPGAEGFEKQQLLPAIRI
jgi:hypothetical protein